MTAPGKPLDLDGMEKVARAVPDHLIHTGWLRTKNPVFGEWQVYADNGRGMGRQHIANTPALKGYGFTDLSEFIATFDPPTVLALIQTQRELVGALQHTPCFGCAIRFGAELPARHQCVTCKAPRALLAKALGEQPL